MQSRSFVKSFVNNFDIRYSTRIIFGFKDFYSFIRILLLNAKKKSKLLSACHVKMCILFALCFSFLLAMPESKCLGATS